MKFLSYNIMSGGFADYSYEIKKPERINLIVEAVKKANADFVSLIDTFRWDTFFSIEELKKIFGYQYIYRINIDDIRMVNFSIGVTVMTNIPNVLFETIRIYNRNGIRSTFDINGNKNSLFSVYLDDKSENTRLMQVEKLNEYLDDKDNAIVAGDLNSLKREDLNLIEKKIIDFINIYPSFKELKPIVVDMMRGEVIERLFSYGLDDGGKSSDQTFPTPLFYKIPTTLARLDYVFKGRNVKLKKVEVLKGEIFEKASDHYPLFFEV